MVISSSFSSFIVTGKHFVHHCCLSIHDYVVRAKPLGTSSSLENVLYVRTLMGKITPKCSESIQDSPVMVLEDLNTILPVRLSNHSSCHVRNSEIINTMLRGIIWPLQMSSESHAETGWVSMNQMIVGQICHRTESK